MSIRKGSRICASIYEHGNLPRVLVASHVWCQFAPIYNELPCASKLRNGAPCPLLNVTVAALRLGLLSSTRRKSSEVLHEFARIAIQVHVSESG